MSLFSFSDKFGGIISSNFNKYNANTNNLLRKISQIYLNRFTRDYYFVVEGSLIENVLNRRNEFINCNSGS